jgi:metal-responsive CopG/Arc/MetJ family transcriptional regulator
VNITVFVGEHATNERDMLVNTKMKLVTLHVPETYIDGLEKLVESNLYPNRSEAIRIAIRDLLKRELWG